MRFTLDYSPRTPPDYLPRPMPVRSPHKRWQAAAAMLVIKRYAMSKESERERERSVEEEFRNKLKWNLRNQKRK